MTVGKVYLVGAGPGDPGLITVKGTECLRKAGVVVYDHLLDETLLECAAEGAERVYVGKSGARHEMEQDEINRLLVEKAKTGRTVVRLKGGDPFVLGRGGEEAEYLLQNGVPFEIVPGVTSAIAVPAYAGIPVTHRGLASSFAIITGHEDPRKEVSSINWAHLARGVDTLVFLMGRANLSSIADKLIENGRPTDTPVAVIRDGTRPEQETVTGTLADIAEKAEKKGLRAPVIIVVGKVAALREKLRWFDNGPLFGKRVLVTRARHQASKLSQLLAESGAVPVELPAIRIEPANGELTMALRSLHDYDWVILTSVNGVEAFFRALRGLQLDARALGGVKVGAIGPATAQALESRGVAPDFIPGEFSAEGILKGLKMQAMCGMRFLLPRADIADTELVDGLRKLGATVQEVAAYRTVPATESVEKTRRLLDSGGIDVITFASSSTVSNLASALGDDRAGIEKVKIACIGPKTAETARKLGFSVDIEATEYTIPGLVAAMEKYFRTEAWHGLS
jgi:uroporphyrinogen III methyltransferase/synthase